MEGRKVVRALLSATLGLGFVFAGSAPTAAQQQKDWKAQGLAPESTHHVAAAKTGSGPARVSVIVQLEDKPLAAQAAEAKTSAPSSTLSPSSQKLDVASVESRTYLGQLARKRGEFENNARRAVPSAQITHRLDVVVNGVALTVPEGDVDKLAKLPGVKAVHRDELLQLDTDRSPQFIGAPSVWLRNGWDDNRGGGIIVGVLDSGIWPEHESFTDPDPDGEGYPEPPPTVSGTRQCEFTGGSNPGPAFSCNNKLIGADRFMATYEAVVGLKPGEFTTARDDNGHGTHTASTAAGNGDVQAAIFGLPRGRISGIAPRAHVMTYKVCGDDGCFSSDSAAAVQKAIQDGVNVINFSISGGVNPYSDIVELAFLDAYNAGIFVAASAGNDGPAPETVNHRAPWVTTVAASTTNRSFNSTVTVTASNGESIQFTGSTVTRGITTPTAVILPPADTNPATDDTLCGSTPGVNPYPPGTFNGEIVICKRGVTGRAEKGFNVFTGGARGMLLYNPAPNQDLNTDNHWVPAVHISNTDGVRLLAFHGSHTGVRATFPAGAPASAEGDVMAAFSSRGGPGQTLGISKPDVTAPGVQILAGHSPQHVDIAGGPNGELFQSIQGTSMSSPHVAGAAALMKQMHPEFTPGQIKSLLMTTAKRNIVKEDGETATTPFDDGSGRISLSNLKRWEDPGITFSETGARYLALQNQLWNANHPSVYIPNMPGVITVQRTAQSTLDWMINWDLRIIEKPNDVKITVPERFALLGGEEITFDITIDARNVPVGQVRHAILRLTAPGPREAHIPITIVRRDTPVKPFSKTCTPSNIPRGGTANCTISATNTSFETANVTITDTLPNRLQLVPGSLVGATQDGNSLSFTGTIAAAQPPIVTIAPSTNAPAPYLPLADFGIAPIPGFGDETIVNFGVPAFTYAGETYTDLGIVSNGYVVVGGGTGSDVDFVNQNLPNAERPNNVLAPFWTDLNPGSGGQIRIGVLTDGVNDWIVVDFNQVREFGSTRFASFNIWIGINGNSPAGQDVTFVYGPTTSSGVVGELTVGAENRFGNRGQNQYFNGTGTLPVEGTELRVSGAPGGPGGTKTITFQARGVRLGPWTNYALMESNLFQGTAVAFASGEVVP